MKKMIVENGLAISLITCVLLYNKITFF